MTPASPPPTKPEREFTNAEIKALSDRDLGSALASVVFLLGFDIEAALITKEAAERLLRR